MQLWSVVSFAGGVGLFLLGMKLLTDGLRVAAGGTLRHILTVATRSPATGIASGVLITAAVQSSSAVVFAIIGFVNAGLLTLSQAVGVIYGANVGTTLTSWVVAVVGFNVNLQALALPAIALGMALRVTGGRSRRAHLGDALAGLGLFFFGIDILRDSFAHLGDGVDLAALAGTGVPALLSFVVIGVILTALMQSSSAALAVTLTAAAGGLIPLHAAAAMVIGANLGTTSTAAFAAIGATAPARRAATAHVLFNVVTGIAAFAALPALLPLVDWIAGWPGTPGNIALALAVFHSVTKLIGVALMWPLTPAMVRYLERRFRTAREDRAQPRHLDRNIVTMPALGIDALALELQRMGEMSRAMLAASLSSEQAAERMLLEKDEVERLGVAINEFAAELGGNAGDAGVEDALASALRVQQYYLDIAERAVEVSRLAPDVELPEGELAELAARYRSAVADFIDATDVRRSRRGGEALDEQRRALESEYQSLKGRLLRAASTGAIGPHRLTRVLDQFSALRRAVDQAAKAAVHCRPLLEPYGPAGGTPVSESG